MSLTLTLNVDENWKCPLTLTLGALDLTAGLPQFVASKVEAYETMAHLTLCLKRICKEEEIEWVEKAENVKMTVG